MKKKTNVVAILKNTKDFMEKNKGAKILLSELAKDFTAEYRINAGHKEAVLNAICVGFAGYTIFERLHNELEQSKDEALKELNKNLIFYDCKLKSGENFGFASPKELSNDEIKKMALEIAGEEIVGEPRRLSPEEAEKISSNLKKALKGEKQNV